MSKIYLPTSEQMDETLANLDKIAGALGSKIDLSSWASVQKAVRLGLAPELLPIGTQLVVSHDTYGDMLYDVVAHDYFKSEGNDNAHTMTLMCHDLLPGLMYDMREAFYYAESELPAGTYNFTISSSYLSWTEGTYQFTLTKALPAGGQLTIDGSSTAALTSYNVKSYVDRTTGNAIETVAITTGDGGTNLGTMGRELNHIHRIAYGSNNYKESAIRQFLNSSAAAGSVWNPQTKFDRPPSWLKNIAGFVSGLDNDFRSIIGEVIVPCSANNRYEAPDSTVAKGEKYTVTDKFYLASQIEIFGTSSDTNADDSVLFPYYEGATNADFIKYQDGSPVNWILRSPVNWTTDSSRIINTKGEPAKNSTTSSLGIVPACTIV